MTGADDRRPRSDVAFTPSVKAIQSARGSRKNYEHRPWVNDWEAEISDGLRDLIEKSTTAFLASATADGQPYVQHRGGPAGFLRVSFADLERCVALAVIDHNLQENSKTLNVPVTEWHRNRAALPHFDDDPQHVLLSFLPGAERQLSPQGISMFALHYYSPWLGALVPQRNRLGKLEVRYDPRDISHLYVRDPETRLFRAVERRDGQLASLTMWEHEAERTGRRAMNQRSSIEKVAFRREITAIAKAAKSSKGQLRDAVRSAHAAAAAKPYETSRVQAPAALEHPPRQKNRLPVEDW